MKASIAAAVLSLAAQANGGYYPSFFRGSLHSRRALQDDYWANKKSQQCLDETDGFFEDSRMSAAFDAVDDEIDDRASCSGLELGKSTCEVDFDTFDSSGLFAMACEGMGGKYIEVNAVIDCGHAFAQPSARNQDIFDVSSALQAANNGGDSVAVETNGGASSDQIAVDGFLFKYMGLMDCVSLECDDGSVQDKIGGAVAKAASTLSSALDATCSHAIEGFSSSTSIQEQQDAPVEEEGNTGPSSAQCRSLMTAAVGVPIVSMALAA